MRISPKIRVPLSFVLVPQGWHRGMAPLSTLGCILSRDSPLCCGLLILHSQALRQAPGLEPMVLAHPANLSLSWGMAVVTVVAYFSIFKISEIRTCQARVSTAFQKIVLLGQNPLFEVSFWHKFQVICSKICVRSTDALPHRKCIENAKGVLSTSEDAVCSLRLSDQG
jgi:hypothetical protein